MHQVWALFSPASVRVRTTRAEGLNHVSATGPLHSPSVRPDLSSRQPRICAPSPERSFQGVTQMEQSVRNPLELALFIQRHSVEIHPRCRVYQSVPSHRWVALCGSYT